MMSGRQQAMRETTGAGGTRKRKVRRIRRTRRIRKQKSVLGTRKVARSLRRGTTKAARSQVPLQTQTRRSRPFEKLSRTPATRIGLTAATKNKTDAAEFSSVRKTGTLVCSERL